MKKHAWKDIKESLASMTPGKPMAEKEEFWEDFKARAKLRTQQQPEAVSRPVIYRWPVAAACATLILAMLGGYFLFMPTEGTACTIESLDIAASHSAVMIMNDEPTESTILWIVDMEAEDTDGDST